MVATLGGKPEFAEVNIDNVKTLQSAVVHFILLVFPTGREMHCTGSSHTYQGEER